MDDKYIALVGGSIGSLITILSTKLFDYLHLNKAHKLSLKREYFLRKLQVFEDTVSYVTVAHVTITNMALILQTLNRNDILYNTDEAQNIFTNLQKSAQQVSDATQKSAGAIDLYIDLKRGQEEVEMTSKFFEGIGMVNKLAADIILNYHDLENAHTEQEYNKLNAIIDKDTETLRICLEGLKQFSSEVREKYLKMSGQLRTELIKYNS
jgi:hypothetical protein